MCRSTIRREFYDSAKNGTNKKEYNAERPLQDNNKEKKAFVPRFFPRSLLLMILGHDSILDLNESNEKKKEKLFYYMYTL